MTMIDPNHYHHHQNISEEQYCCHKAGVYVATTGRPRRKYNFKGRVGTVMMSGREGYGCSSQFEFELAGSDSESESESESESGQDHHRNMNNQNMVDQKDESRTTESAAAAVNIDEATASTSLIKDIVNIATDQEEDEKWLQLSIGGGLTAASHNSQYHPLHTQISSTMIELDLLPAGTTTTTSSPPAASTFDFGSPLPLRPSPPPPANVVTTGGGNGASSSSSYFNYYSSTTSTTNASLFMHHHHHHAEIEFNWGAFRPIHHQRNIILSSSSPSSRLVPPSASSGGPYFAQPPPPSSFLLQYPGLGLAGTVPRSSSTSNNIDFRVIDPPPRRPSSAIWFILQAAPNQAKEPFLPQIPKSFLRIKDGRMTIKIVIKYLANKLNLENESEVEIKCRGQQILPMLTLQHVRDGIWTASPSHIVTLLPDSPTTDHIMVLHYGRSPN